MSAGTSNNVPSVTSHTRCRAPADARRIVTVMASAATRISVAFASSSSIDRFDDGSAKTLDRRLENMLSPALTGAANCVAKTCDFRIVQVNVRHPKERGHSLLRRVAEISSNYMREHVVSGTLG